MLIYVSRKLNLQLKSILWTSKLYFWLVLESYCLKQGSAEKNQQTTCCSLARVFCFPSFCSFLNTPSRGREGSNLIFIDLS